MDAGIEIQSPEMESIARTVWNIPANDGHEGCLTPKLPRRLQRRLLESKSAALSAQDIEAKLHQAYLRRKKFYESLSNKARPKPSSRGSSSQEKYLGLRLKAKHNAAEQKRLSILAEIQNRLARLDQLRRNAKNGLHIRFVKQRDELSAKVESRMQQATVNRMLVLNTHRQRQVAKSERASQLLTRRLIQEKKYKECISAVSHDKRSAAERKRLGFLEAQRSRARARALQVQQVARFVDSQRETERRKLQSRSENHSQRAKRVTAEYLKKRGALLESVQVSSEMTKQKELARKLKRCWRRFVRLKGTTVALAKAFKELEINQKAVRSISFETLSVLLGSTVTIRIAKDLLQRLENRIIIKQGINSVNRRFHMENIDHLLKRVISPNKRENSSDSQSSIRLARYPVRVVLGAYMILGHPDVVSCGIEDDKSGLVGAAENLAQEFDLLIAIILQGSISSSEEACIPTGSKLNFSSQLENFDQAWCSFLYHFVIWKVKDAKSLEEDLIRATCKLEFTRMDTLKRTMERDSVDFSYTKAFLDQVTLQQRFLQEKVLQIGGGVGLERMEIALSETRAGFADRMELQISSSSLTDHTKSPRAAGSLTGSGKLQSRSRIMCATRDSTADDHRSPDQMLVTENEWIVNGFVHGEYSGFPESLNVSDKDQNSIKLRVRDIMEKAFWEGIMETLKQETPDYSWVLKLIEEVRDELCELSPSSWRQEIELTIDLDILLQVVQVGSLDIEYCGRILDFSLVTLQKLSAPAKEDELRTAHQKLLRELAEISQDKSNTASATLTMKGLRFVLQEIQALKHDISKTRIGMIEPLMKGPAGIEYLKSCFFNRYGSPSDALDHLPLVKQWLSAILVESEQDWDEYQDSATALKSIEGGNSDQYSPITLRAGSSTLRISRSSDSSTVAGVTQPDCEGEKLDVLLRVGLLKLVSEVEGLTVERLPETFKLNLFKLRTIQSQLQKIIVISTSILVLRQILISEHLVTSGTNMENLISNCAEQLSELLDRKEDVGISEMVEMMNSYPNSGEDSERKRARKEIMANMLGKSLSAGDAVFMRVSHCVYLAARGIVLGGSGLLGKKLAETSLKRIGAALLTQKLVDAVAGVVVLANVSASVHRAWYEQILCNI